MADQSLRKKLALLSAEVKKAPLTLTEEFLVEIKATGAAVASRATVVKAIAETVNKSEAEVLVCLSANNNTDRLLDEVVQELKRSK